MRVAEQPSVAGISASEFAERRRRAEAATQRAGLDALIAFSSTSLQGASAYLTGYEPRFGPKEVTVVVLVPNGPATLVSYAYWDELAPMPWLDEVIIRPNLQAIATIVAERLPERAERIGIVGYAHFPAPFALEIARARPAARFEDATSLLLEQAMVKTEAEIQLLRAAARMTDAGVGAFLDAVREDVEETELAIAVEKAVLEAGAERLAFPSLIFTGERVPVGIGLPAHRRVRPGDQVNIVCGALHRGYKMDIGRITTAGRPDPDVSSVMECAAAMIEAMLGNVRPDVGVRAISDAAMQVVRERSLTDLSYPHAAPGYVGHGIGCWLDEPPRLASDEVGTIKGGMVLVLEARLGRAGRPGATITDPVVVTASGAERLSRIPIRTWLS